MAGIDVGARGSRRGVVHELPLVPFIDFLLCLVMFLLVTAVWSEHARLDAHAIVPGRLGAHSETPIEPILHVEVRGDREFEILWRRGTVVESTTKVPRLPERDAQGAVRYPELARRVALEWSRAGLHRRSSDPNFDQAVVHADNAVEFADLAAVLDAVSSPRREARVAGHDASNVPAFLVALAVN